MYQAAPQANAGSLSSRYPPLPQSLSLDLTFLATVVLVLTALSLFFNLPTRKPN